MCRQTQLFHMRIEKDKGTKVDYKTVEHTTGFTQLPWPGGMLDQPFRLMELFALFRKGDAFAASKVLNK